MHDMHWWIGVIAFSLTTLVFLVSMVAFFRPRPGCAALRLALLGGIVTGLWIIVASLWRRDGLDGLSLWAGCALLASAHGFFWPALRAHGSHRPSAAFAGDPPDWLTMRGPYRLMRHPFYVAYVLGFAGGASLAGSALAWAAVLWMGCLYAVAARQEERLILATPMGAAYRLYMREVGALATTPTAAFVLPLTAVH